MVSLCIPELIGAVEGNAFSRQMLTLLHIEVNTVDSSSIKKDAFYPLKSTSENLFQIRVKKFRSLMKHTQRKNEVFMNERVKTALSHVCIYCLCT